MLYEVITVIEKAIQASDLGLNPSNDGKIVRIPIPPLTEERRKEIVKQVKSKGEDFKVSVRNERRDAKELIEASEKDGELAADDAKKALDKMQKETDEGVKGIDEIVASKEKDVITSYSIHYTKLYDCSRRFFSTGPGSGSGPRPIPGPRRGRKRRWGDRA